MAALGAGLRGGLCWPRLSVASCSERRPAFTSSPPRAASRQSLAGSRLGNSFAQTTSPFQQQAKRSSRPSLPRRSAQRPAASAVAASAAIAGDGADVPAEKKGFLGIEAFTWQKIVPLGFMFFCILFNYTILRDTKDVLVVTAPGSGAETIPFLKTWVNLPMAIGFTVIYAKLANVLSTEALFYACILPFIAFFGAFAFIMYPLRDVLHPTAFAEQLLNTAGARFAGPISILRNWTFCLFYVMAELWGSVVVSLLFWGFANQITTVDEAKTFYPLFGLGANVALIFSGRAVKYFSNVRSRLPPGVDGWGYSLKGMMGMVVIGGLLITGTYWLLQRTVVPRVQAGQPKKKKNKPNMSVGESFTFLAKSPYIRDLALLVVSYGISINLVEVTWKGKIKQQFPNPNDYSSFMGDFSSATGAVTFIMMLLSRVIFRKYGWGVAAQITPTVLLITGVAFFGLVLFSGPLTPWLATINLTPLMAAVLIGAAQNVFSKSAKYSLFDPCKEMAYIPLDQETQLKGKAAIDVVCNPLGKSGGSAIQQVMIICFGSLAASTPYLGAILLGVVFMWIGAAGSLNKQFTELQQKEQLAKLAMARQALASAPTTKKFKFISGVNDQGFIEGKYVPLEEGENVTASMDIVEADSPEDAASKSDNGKVGIRAKVE
ncbi:ADP,ATP carrier protein 1 [Coccomyxa sp. Obi]|nr:ADP,ATP carrier protein 1 [Coccomyxa sp. Obi]